MSGTPSLHDVRALVGPNVWRLAPAVAGELRGGTGEALARARARLGAAPVGAVPDDAVPDDAVPDDATGPPVARWAALVGGLAVGLQRRAGIDVGWWRTADGSDDDARAVAIEYEEERVGVRALRLAHALATDAAAPDGAPSGDWPALVEGAVAELRALNEREHLGPTASVLVAEARRRGIPVHRVPGDPVVRLGHGRRLRRLDATLTDRTSVIATDITSDKDRTKRVLARLGIPVPRGDVARSLDEALEIAEDIDFPLVVKPLDANNGRGISTRLATLDAVRDAYARARAEHPLVVVERHVEGHDHRVLVVDGRVVAVTERVPAHVVGDGRRTIRALAEETNRDPRRSEHDPTAPLAPLPLDELTSEFLARGGRTLDDVPAAGETVYLRGTANISTGGIPIDRTDAIHPRNATLCVFAADAVGLDVAGIDVLTPDIGIPFDENDAAIVEVNASPGIRMHTEPERGTARDVPGAILDMLFPPGREARIPIVAVTGTNGKTTTTRLVAHLFRQTERCVGYTTTDGVYFDEQLVYEGDMTGPMAAEMVLSNPRVDAAVLETARGGILRAGLGFDGCDVSVVLNVSADHLGLRGIHTVEQLAAVKSVVVAATRPTGHTVLNADDPLVLAMRERTAARLVLFTGGPLAASAPARAHVAAGGRAVSVEAESQDAGERLVLHEGATRRELVELTAIPLTLGGRARFQVQNVAAAVGAAWAAGVDPARIVAGLRTFTASAATTPGRMNQLEVNGATVVIDYAHNVAAVSALLDYAARVPAARRIGVFGVPGDRRDDDIRALGALATPLDRVVFKEHPHYRRGREPGAIARLMCDGLEAQGGDPARAILVEDEPAAVEAVRRMLAPGDLVLFLADDADAVADALRAAAGEGAGAEVGGTRR